MGQLVLWALATGVITGVVWATIVLVSSRRRDEVSREELDARLDELLDAQRQVAELEERLQFTERLLTQPKAEPRLPPAER